MRRGHARHRREIASGLVHADRPLSRVRGDSGIDFDLPSLDPVASKGHNERTARELKPAEIVRGVKQTGGGHVVISDEEARAALPRKKSILCSGTRRSRRWALERPTTCNDR
jgi:non-homologous end joining protein Ku